VSGVFREHGDLDNLVFDAVADVAVDALTTAVEWTNFPEAEKLPPRVVSD